MSSIASTADAVALAYGTDHARAQQTTSAGATLYMNSGNGVMNERFVPTTGTPTWRNYIMADGHAVALRATRGSNLTLNYFVLDHLGSVVAITDSSTTTVVRQSYDAWGRMRIYATGAPDTTCSLPGQSPTTRGYTNQEQMPGVCLDNYNARLYDPQIGRFLAADPSDGSGLNRYWYVGDNPLSLTDPTGLCMGVFGCAFAFEPKSAPIRALGAEQSSSWNRPCTIAIPARFGASHLMPSFPPGRVRYAGHRPPAARRRRPGKETAARASMVRSSPATAARG